MASFENFNSNSEDQDMSQDVGRLESIYDVDGRIEDPNIAHEIALLEDVARAKERDIAEGQDYTEREKRNMAMMRVLEEQPEYEGALQKQTLSNGQDILIFQRGAFPFIDFSGNYYQSVEMSRGFKHSNHLVRGVLSQDNAIYIFSKDGVIVAGMDNDRKSATTQMYPENIKKWYENNLERILELVSEVNPERLSFKDPNNVAILPAGLYAEDFKESLPLLNRRLMEASQLSKKSLNTPEKILEAMKARSS